MLLPSCASALFVFEVSYCIAGPVAKIRLLSDYNHVSSIAFVEFAKFESAKTALDCSGALLGLLPIRVCSTIDLVLMLSCGRMEL